MHFSYLGFDKSGNCKKFRKIWQNLKNLDLERGFLNNFSFNNDEDVACAAVYQMTESAFLQ